MRLYASTSARASLCSAARRGARLQTVKDVVAGAGLQFRERGATEIKGVPGQWWLYAVDAGA
jgi:hypothetical protein